MSWSPKSLFLIDLLLDAHNKSSFRSKKYGAVTSLSRFCPSRLRMLVAKYSIKKLKAGPLLLMRRGKKRVRMLCPLLDKT